MSILELHAEVGGDDLTAGEHCDILKHFLTSVAEAGGLDAYAGEGAAQLVEDDGCKSLALDILCDDEELSAGLDDLLEQGQDLLNVGDLLIGDEDESVLEDCFHLLGVGCHVGAEIAAVKLHAFNDLAVGLCGLGLLNGDNAVLRNLLHSFGDQGADNIVAAGDSADTGNIARCRKRAGSLHGWLQRQRRLPS